jgi:hypothetical protein
MKASGADGDNKINLEALINKLLKWACAAPSMWFVVCSGVVLCGRSCTLSSPALHTQTRILRNGQFSESWAGGDPAACQGHRMCAHACMVLRMHVWW